VGDAETSAACAATGEVVVRDNDLLALGTFRGIKVMTVVEFLGQGGEYLRNKSEK
jgi:hypothetical protein